MGRAVNLWPTPNVPNGGRRAHHAERRGAGYYDPETGKKVQLGLEQAVQWATPKASPSGPDFARANRAGSGGDDLATQVARWATPTTQDAANNGGPSQHRRNSLPLNAQVHLAQYPTPSATTYGSSGNGDGNNVASRGRPSLETMARTGNWPTPTAMDAAGFCGKPPTAGDSKGSGSRNTEGSNAHAGVSVADAVRGDGGTGRQEHAEKPAPLNPAWVCWLMGWPENWTDLEPMKEGELTEWADRVMAGEHWSADPADEGRTLRTARDVAHRPAKLRALGNGQVPLSFVCAWLALEPRMPAEQRSERKERNKSESTFEPPGASTPAET